MEQGYLLDTNTIIYFLEGTLNESGKKYLLDIVKDGTKISIISKIELLAWNPPPGTNSNSINEFLKTARIFSLDDTIADQTIQIKKAHRKIKLPDAIIAATALCFGYTLISRNVSDFSIIDELTTIDPFKT
jgi:predicted nucleic acid-binding protein